MPRFGAFTVPYLKVLSGSGHYLFLPVLTTTQRNALSPARGWAVYNSTTEQVESYNGTAWVAVGKLYGDNTFLPLAGGALTGDVTVAALKTIDGVDISVHAADLAAHTQDWMQLLRTGEYFYPFPLYVSSTAALNFDQLIAIPFHVARALTIDRLAIQITAAAVTAGKKGRLGIYNNGTNLYPGTLVVDGGEVAIDAIAIVAATISQALTKGLYWLVVFISQACTVVTYRPAYPVMGQTATDFALSSAYGRWEASLTYAAMPTTFTAGGTKYTANNPAILPRLLSLD